MGDVRVLLDQDQTTVNRLVDWHANPGSHRHIDPDLEANDFVHVARNGNIDEIRLVVKGSGEYQNRGNTQWLETGDDSAGLEHILQRHGTDDQFYAIDGINSPDDIKNAIRSSIKHGETHRIPNDEGGGTAYIHQYTPNDQVTVIVGDNGYVVTARPGDYP